MTKITVIGAGPGGYAAALKAAIMGGDVTLIEKETLGGTCLNKGCIPTKALLAGESVLKTKEYSLLAERKDLIVKKLVGGIDFLTKGRGVRVIYGTGKILSENKVSVTKSDGTSEILDTDKIIIATGSVPVVPGFIPYDGKTVITSDEALALTRLPKSIAIIGGGVIGCEFGQFYARSGVAVTIIEMMPHILPSEDTDVANVLLKQMKKDGINVLTDTKVDTVATKDEKAVITLAGGEVIEADTLLVSIGRKAFIEDIGIEDLGIETENGKITVNNRMETSVKGIYAIGDTVNTPFLAHVAEKEAMVAVDNIFDKNTEMTYNAIPRCVYTSPEIAGVGITEANAKAKNIAYKTGKFLFANLGKAMVMNETAGFVKIITDNEDTIIGASIAGPHSTDMISELTLAVQLRLSARELGSVVHPHPTLSEAIMEAAHAVHNECINSL